MSTFTNKPEVVVAMSGGVDSSVAAALLCHQGYRVTGVTMKVWGGRSLEGQKRHGCYGPGEENDIADAQDVARQLGIPFLVVDLTTEYREEILDYVKEEYLQGRTPNPCSRCNPRIKFGALISEVSKLGVRYDYIATGHYARIEYDKPGNRFLLKKATDSNKDQSYFLALLPRTQISHTLFPLGGYLKTEVRKLAAKFNLKVSHKADSQDFVAGGYDSLLDIAVPGPILDENGKEIGRHKGIIYHTIGQRRGLGIASTHPLYVTGIDPQRNTVTVGERSKIYSDSLLAADLNWIAFDALRQPLIMKAKIRSRHDEAEVLVTPVEPDKAYIKFKESQMAITPGQTVVFYDRDVVVGGGIITGSGKN
jgi:tRNA-uridine 2-sulfurtransferase